MESFGEISSFIWGVADLIRDTFKRGKYQDVILPLTVLRRLDCVLEPTRDDVLKRCNSLKGRLDNLDPQLRQASGYAFYNTSRFSFPALLQDSANVAANLRVWINGFSENMREVLEKFDFDNTITKLDQGGLLFLVLERFNTIDLHPDRVDNHAMGMIFEDLIRRFNEALNENPGEHFTPRDVVRLMGRLMIAPDSRALQRGAVVRTVYDPCCGTGGMLTIARNLIEAINAEADIHLYGQEVNPESYAVCKSDLFIKTRSGRDADNIRFGSTLSREGHAGVRFDYLITNPPYGKDWKMDQAAVKAEHTRAFFGRFGAGLPRISDGQLLFLQHMVAHMKRPEDGGSRMCIIMNGSPLFTGDAGSGESEIRRWLMEEDLVEATIALPGQLFYNTGIATYVWVVSNRKPPARVGTVQLIDASGEEFWKAMRKSLGDKRREITAEQIDIIVDTYASFDENERSKIFDSSCFGYRKIVVERPLRLNFQAGAERIERLKDERAFRNLAISKKKNPDWRAADEAAGRQRQEAILRVLDNVQGRVYKDRQEFLDAFEAARRAVPDSPLEPLMKMPAALRKAILSGLSERDENAAVCRGKDGKPEPDPELRDTERVPLSEDINVYFEREVTPHVPDAWINASIVDQKDGKVGKVGYEISFNRYFYVYTPPRPLDEIEGDLRKIEGEIAEMLQEMMR